MNNPERKHEFRGMDRHSDIYTPCPSCGFRSLFVANKGHLTCSRLGCKSPGVERAISEFQSAPPVRGATQDAEAFLLEEYGNDQFEPYHVSLIQARDAQWQARVAELDNENNDLCGWVDDLKARVEELEKALIVMPKPPGSDIDTVYLRKMQEWWYRVGRPTLGGGE